MVDELEALAAELAAERAKLEEIDAKRAPSPADRVRAELAAAKRARAEAETMVELEVVHGPEGKKLLRVTTPEGMIVVAAPSGARNAFFRRFVDQGKTDTAALERLVRGCLVHPDPATFDRIIGEYPAALGQAANAVCTLAGIRKEEITEK